GGPGRGTGRGRNPQHAHAALDRGGRPGRSARRMDRCQALERTAPEAGPGGGAAAGQHETDAAMIEVDEAKRRMMAHLVLLPLEEIPLGEGWGRYAARAMAAPFDHPLFDCSAMDGYALDRKSVV